MSTAAAPPPASTSEALAMLTSAMTYLAAADVTQLTASEQAECPQRLEQADAIETAARASVLGAFTAGQGYCEDADYSPRAWLIQKTRVTKGAATGHAAMIRARAHPRIMAALADGEMSESYARTLCLWTGKLPEQCRDTADEILSGAARKGMALRDLAALAAEIQSRAHPDPDDDPGRSYEDRAVRLEATFQGAGVLFGDLMTGRRTIRTGVGPDRHPSHTLPQPFGHRGSLDDQHPWENARLGKGDLRLEER